MSLADHKEFCCTFGRLCIRFQDLERALKYLYSSLRSISAPQGIIETEPFGVAQLLKKLKKLGATDTDIHSIIEDAVALNDKRNKLIHSLWDERPNDDGAFGRRKVVKTGDSKSRYTIERVDVTPSDIDKLSAQCELLVKRILAVCTDPVIDDVVNGRDDVL